MPADEDQRLLQLLQRQVPLVPRPFAQIAQELGSDQQAVMDRVAALRSDGVIREISGIFDAAALGYRQALVAMQVPPDRLHGSARCVCEHPGVSHCYGREGRFNLWYTLAVSPTSSLGLEKTAAVLAGGCGAGSHLLLPTIRRYKLHVQFGEAQEQDEPASAATVQDVSPAGTLDSASCPSLDPAQVRAIRALQIDLPAKSQPFAPLAREAQMDVRALLDMAGEFLHSGYMRRYAAVVHHQAAGAAANVLVAWNVSQAQADAAGARCAALASVSHCYLRPKAPNWPYNLYTMIHGHTRGDCEMSIAEIVATAGLLDRAELWTLKEYKKQRVPLFSGLEHEWEAA